MVGEGSADGTVNVADVKDTVTRHLSEAGFAVFTPESDGLPSLVAAHPTHGLIAIDLVDKPGDATVELNRKVSRLRNDVPEVDRVRTRRLLIASDLKTSDGQSFTTADAVAGTFLPTCRRGRWNKPPSTRWQRSSHRD